MAISVTVKWDTPLNSSTALLAQREMGGGVLRVGYTERFVDDQGMLWQSSRLTGVWGLAFSIHCEKTELCWNESRGQVAQGRDPNTWLLCLWESVASDSTNWLLTIFLCLYIYFFRMQRKSFCTNNHRNAAVFFLLWRFDCLPGKAGARTHSNGLL